MPRALVLGGTVEARAVCQGLLAEGYEVTLALKGLTKTPGVPTGATLRSGGFGGPQGLAAYLRESQTSLLIDATHPFAATMSRNAAQASRQSSTLLLAVQRPPWHPRPGDRWTRLNSLGKAVQRLRAARAQSILLALGGQGAESFRACPQHRFQARVLANSNTALATHAAHRWRGLSIVRIETRQTVTSEMARMRRFGADLMIVRDAGGILDAKLTAARRLKVLVWIIDRPTMPQVPIFKSPSALLNYLGSARAGV